MALTQYLTHHNHTTTAQPHHHTTTPPHHHSATTPPQHITTTPPQGVDFRHVDFMVTNSGSLIWHATTPPAGTATPLDNAPASAFESGGALCEEEGSPCR